MTSPIPGVTVIDHPLVQHKLSLMRNKDTSTAQFRRLLREISTLIFMTSNLASEQISKLAAGETPVMTDSITETIRPVLTKHFKPALLARMNIIPYLPIANDVMHELVLLRLQKLSQRVASRGIALTFAAAVVTAIAESCTRTDTGARNIDFLVNNYLLPAISDRILKALTQQENIRGIRVVQDENGNFELIIG